jgi:hypothetical protein
MNERPWDLSDDALGRRLQVELPRHAAPARLRAAVTDPADGPGERRAPWLVPALAAAGTALVLSLGFVPLLPRAVPADPVLRLTRAVVSEHARALMWGARRPDIIPTAMSWLAQETGIELASVFAGDDQLAFVAAEPVYLDHRRGVALHYRDPDGHHLTYLVLPAPGLTVPERNRMKVDRFRPALLHDAGFSVWVWKHGDLACFLVSDMVSEADVTRFKDYFVRVRLGTEPVPLY